MSKVVLPTIGGGYLDTELINAAFRAIEAGFDNTVSRNGAIPNYMSAPLDLNSQPIQNNVDATARNEVPSYGQVQDLIDAAASGLVLQRRQQFTASAGQTLFTLTQFVYTPGANNLAVYVNGLRKFPGLDYTETDPFSFTFLAGLSAGQIVSAVVNDFLGTTYIPNLTVSWSNISGIPVYATRWPAWEEVSGKPSTFTPSAHQHSASDITSGRLADARRGVYVQAAQPTGAVAGDLWFW